MCSVRFVCLYRTKFMLSIMLSTKISSSTLMNREFTEPFLPVFLSLFQFSSITSAHNSSVVQQITSEIGVEKYDSDLIRGLLPFALFFDS